MHFAKIAQNGLPFHLDLDRIESVREIAPNTLYSRDFRSLPKGGLAIYMIDSAQPYVLTVNAEINAFYVAFCAACYPNQPLLTSTLGA